MVNPSSGEHRIFVGTYTRGTSLGIYAVTLDARSGALGTPRLAATTPNPTFIALSPDRRFLYAVCANDAWACSFGIDPATLALTPVQQAPAGTGPTPCHISVDAAGAVAVAANYHLGLAAAFGLNADGTLGKPCVVAHSGKGPHPIRQDVPHVHSAYFSPDGVYALVCDLGLDRVYTYRLGRNPASLCTGPASFTTTAPGAGPRHLAFGADGRRVYVINELANTVAAYGYDAPSGRLSPLQTVSVLPEGYQGEAKAAEVRVHPGGRFLYGSCRGPDTLSVFGIDASTGLLSPIETIGCGGKGPRNFTLSPDGAWLVCAHQDSNSLSVFAVDAVTGRLSRSGGMASVSMPVCLAFFD